MLELLLPVFIDLNELLLVLLLFALISEFLAFEDELATVIGVLGGQYGEEIPVDIVSAIELDELTLGYRCDPWHTYLESVRSFQVVSYSHRTAPLQIFRHISEGCRYLLPSPLAIACRPL